MEIFNVGDEVYTKDRWGINTGKVEKLTKTQVITTIGKFRYNGFSIGKDAWSTTILEHLTLEIKEKIKLKRLENRIKQFPLDKIKVTEQNSVICEQVLRILESLVKGVK